MTVSQYCGSCYLHGALSMVQDRISIMTKGMSRVMLGRQVRKPYRHLLIVCACMCVFHVLVRVCLMVI